MHMQRWGAGGIVVVNMVADLPPGTSQQLLQEIKLSPKTSPQIPSWYLPSCGFTSAASLAVVHAHSERERECWVHFYTFTPFLSHPNLWDSPAVLPWGLEKSLWTFLMAKVWCLFQSYDEKVKRLYWSDTNFNAHIENSVQMCLFFLQEVNLTLRGCCCCCLAKKLIRTI